jgi:hypothetical protein
MAYYEDPACNADIDPPTLADELETWRDNPTEAAWDTLVDRVHELERAAAECRNAARTSLRRVMDARSRVRTVRTVYVTLPGGLKACDQATTQLDLARKALQLL